MKSLAAPLLVLATLAGSTCGCHAPASAGILVADSDPTQSINADRVGRVDQASTMWPQFGCGPTAAVNSFIFLQNQYPQYYGTKLVPAGQDVATANTLGGLMNTNNVNGTFWTQFILGKMSYINSHAPRTTTVSGMYDSDALEVPQGTQLPPTIKGDAPTPDFLLGELQNKEDVELLFQGDQNHFITLTSITWDPATHKGTINYIDPLGGKLVQNVAIQQYDTGYPLFTTVGNTEIELAVSESPVPEPAVIVLLVSAAPLALASAGRARTKRRDRR